MNFRKSIFLLLLISLFSVYAETAEPYTYDEFPGIMHDLRRAEVITLGAMPFITFNVTLGYSFGKYASHNFNSDYFVNPFASDSDNSFNKDEQVGIILTSIGISAGIGVTDFIVHSIKRSNQYRRQKKNKNTEIIINPVQKDPEATKIESEPPLPPENPENESENQKVEEQENDSEKHIKSGKELKVVSKAGESND